MSNQTNTAAPTTQGLHHLGLAVPNLQECVSFFCDVLHYKFLAERPDYPAAFVTDGTTMLTLWQVEDPETATPFDRRKNVGLHHFAMRAGSISQLQALHDQFVERPDITVEFAPCATGGAGAQHFICLIPGGLRMEFIGVPEN